MVVTVTALTLAPARCANCGITDPPATTLVNDWRTDLLRDECIASYSWSDRQFDPIGTDHITCSQCQGRGVNRWNISTRTPTRTHAASAGSNGESKSSGQCGKPSPHIGMRGND